MELLFFMTSDYGLDRPLNKPDLFFSFLYAFASAENLAYTA